MLDTKFKRQTIACVIIAFASFFLYPIAQAGTVLLIWFLLGWILLAAFLTLITK